MGRANVIKRYASCAVFCVVVLVVGILLSLSISIRINWIGGKPPFVFSLLLLIVSLFILIMTAYQAYIAWFDAVKTQERVGLASQQLAKRLGPFRFLVITNRVFLLWYIRIVYPVIALLSFGLFTIVLFNAF